MGELGLYEGLSIGVSITVTLIDWDISQDKRSCLPCMRAQLLGKRERGSPPKHTHLHVHMLKTHLQVVSLLPFFSQAPETQMFLLLYLLRFGVASNTQLMCPLFSLSVIFSSLWSHHLLHYSADRTLKFNSRESTVFVCLPQDSAVFILLIIHQGSVFWKSRLAAYL